MTSLAFKKIKIMDTLVDSSIFSKLISRDNIANAMTIEQRLG